MIIHVLGHAVTENSSFKGYALLNPVRLLLSRQIHAEYEHLASEQDLILSCPDIQLSDAHVGEQHLPDALFCTRQRHLFLDPVCIFLRHSQPEQIHFPRLSIDRYVALNIFRQLLVPDPFSPDLNLRHDPQTQLPGMNHRGCKLCPYISQVKGLISIALRIYHLLKRQFAFQYGRLRISRRGHVQNSKIHLARDLDIVLHRPDILGPELCLPLNDPFHIFFLIRHIIVLVQIKLVEDALSLLRVMNRFSDQLHISPPQSNKTSLSIYSSCTTT